LVACRGGVEAPVSTPPSFETIASRDHRSADGVPAIPQDEGFLPLVSAGNSFETTPTGLILRDREAFVSKDVLAGVIVS